MRGVLLVIMLALPVHVLALSLNGIAEYKYLSNTQYIASIQVDSPRESLQALLESNNVITMSIVITADRIRDQSFRRHWVSGVMINTYGSNTLSAQDSPFLQWLFSLFDSNPSPFVFKRGDIIEIIYRESQGIAVTLNTINIFNSKSANGFNEALSVWIGNRPPSTLFKERLLGEIKDDQNELLIAEVGKLFPSASRVKYTSSYLLSAADKELEDKKPANITAAPLANIDLTAKPLDIPALIKPAIGIPGLSSSFDGTVEMGSASTTHDSVLEDIDIIPGETELQLLTERAEAELKARDAIMEYENIVRKIVASNAGYPAGAYDKHREGKVKLLLTITAAGRVRKASYVDKAKWRELNIEARSAAKTARLPKFPPEIITSTHQVSIIISFSRG